MANKVEIEKKRTNKVVKILPYLWEGTVYVVQMLLITSGILFDNVYDVIIALGLGVWMGVLELIELALKKKINSFHVFQILEIAFVEAYIVYWLIMHN